MVRGIVLGTALIQLIEAVTAAENQSAAMQTLLKSLLEIFQMDQAALFVKEAGGSFQCLLAFDSTGKILSSNQEIFSSTTLLDRALLAMEPINMRLATHSESTPKSIKGDLLKQVVCLPLTRSPGTAIFLGSRMLAAQDFSEEEMGQFKTAARAAWLAIRQFKTQESLAQTRDELKSLKDERNSLVFSSRAMVSVMAEVGRVAPFNVSLLLTGESGVGKEEVARHVHGRSGRSGAFVAVNCANLSESLLESELFGYRKGAFTGAIQNKNGLFKSADGGTLFLDELAELPINLQAKLLRALQERKIRPVGSNEDVPIDVRIIAATHQDLEKRISSGEFRADLYYRVQEFVVRLPALRERPEDIELLAELFTNQASLEMNLPRRQLTPEALAKLKAHHWSGNVRELKSICRTAVILARDTAISPQDLRLSPSLPTPSPMAPPVPMEEAAGLSLRELSRQFEAQVVKKMLAQGASQVEVASQLNISVRTLQRITSGADPILNDSPSESSPFKLEG